MAIRKDRYTCVKRIIPEADPLRYNIRMAKGHGQSSIGMEPRRLNRESGNSNTGG